MLFVLVIRYLKEWDERREFSALDERTREGDIERQEPWEKRSQITAVNSVVTWRTFADFPLISRPLPTASPNIMRRIESKEVGLQTVNTDALFGR